MINVNYATLYFKYLVPTAINREPTNKSIKRLKIEICANASSVDIYLGDGDHGYLDLYLSGVEYAWINPTPTPLEALAQPGALTINPAAAAAKAVHAKETYHGTMRVYCNCKNIKKALLRHIQNALEHKYIQPLLNDDTGLIENDLPTVLTYLDTNYGKVLPEQVKQKESEVLSISFNPMDFMVVLYCPIEQLQKLATAAGITYSPRTSARIRSHSYLEYERFRKGPWRGEEKCDRYKNIGYFQDSL